MYDAWMPNVSIRANLDDVIGQLTSRTREGSSG